MNDKEFKTLYGDDSPTKQMRKSVKVLIKSLNDSPVKDYPEILKLKAAAESVANCSEKMNNDLDMSLYAKTSKDRELALKALKLSNTRYIDAINDFNQLNNLDPKVDGKPAYKALKVYIDAQADFHNSRQRIDNAVTFGPPFKVEGMKNKN